MEDQDAYAPSLEDHKRIIQVLQRGLRDSKRRPVALPIEVGEPVKPLFNALTRDPIDARTLEEWATTLHLSRRTFTRMVHSEAGMSFTQLRSRIRFLHALQGLGAGQEVRAVATKSGYKNVSAFVVRFREEFGITPGKYFA